MYERFKLSLIGIVRFTQISLLWPSIVKLNWSAELFYFSRRFVMTASMQRLTLRPQVSPNLIGRLHNAMLAEIPICDKLDQMELVDYDYPFEGHGYSEEICHV